MLCGVPSSRQVQVHHALRLRCYFLCHKALFDIYKNKEIFSWQSVLREFIISSKLFSENCFVWIVPGKLFPENRLRQIVPKVYRHIYRILFVKKLFLGVSSVHRLLYLNWKDPSFRVRAKTSMLKFQDRATYQTSDFICNDSRSSRAQV